MDYVAEKQKAPVRAVDFYGESKTWPTFQLLHSETLVVRSEAHDWKIRAHRHVGIHQLFYVASGRGQAVIDSTRYALEEPGILVVPEGCIHEFDWEQGSNGYVLSIAADIQSKLSLRFGHEAHVWSAPTFIPINKSTDTTDLLFGQIHAEYETGKPLGKDMLEALIKVLIVWLARRCNASSAETSYSSRANTHVDRFQTLIDKHHRDGWSVVDYADAIGVTSSHLNQVVKSVTGKTALQLIHEEILHAAQRELTYTEKSITQVSLNLGYLDPAYFTRFFKRHIGVTPRQFRKSGGILVNFS